MKRRDFINLVAAAGIPAFLPGKSVETASRNKGLSSELDGHTISDIQFTDVALRYPRQVGKNSRLGIHGMGPTVAVAVLKTDRGASGWGMVRGPKRAVRFASYLKDKTVAELIDPRTGITDRKAMPFDISLHDLAGVILEKPVYELMGRTEPMITNCYSGMIYFDDLEPEGNPAGIDRILEECQYDYELGYRQFKLKIGRGNKWMAHDEGLKRDIEVTRLVASNFPDCDILVDANNGYNLDDTIAYLEGIGEIDLFWFEEPFHENRSDYIALRKWLIENEREVLLADAEFRPKQELLRELYRRRVLDIHLTDIIGLGFSRWRNLMPELIEMGISASPHGWGSLFKTYYISHLAAAYGNTPTIEGVTCSSDDVDFGNYKLEEGKIMPSPEPGFGMKLLKKP